MYLEFFGLEDSPFRITPNTAYFFPGGNRGAILDALIYAITHGEGIVKVTGEVGSGKTMLCRMLEGSLPSEVETVYIAHPRLGPEELLAAIAQEMKLALPSEPQRLSATQAIYEHLLARLAQGRRVVLFVEEAQAMPVSTLEELRLLSNLETGSQKLMQIVLFGQPELDDLLLDPAIRPLRERIVHAFHLDPLAPADIRAYLDFRMRQAGYHGPEVFSPAAVRAIARASQGLIRRVNILADKALLLAYTEGVHRVTPRHVSLAARDSAFVDFQAPRRRRLVAGGLLLCAVGGAGFALGGWLDPWRDSERSRSAAPPSPAPAPAPAASVPVAAKAVNAVDLARARFAATRHWLDTAAPTTLSWHIELLAADEKKLAQHLQQLSRRIDVEQVFVYRTQAGGRPMISVLYGSFADRAQAEAALARLPSSLKAQRPYLRSVQGVRKEIQQVP